jgi:hypothetical protein
MSPELVVRLYLGHRFALALEQANKTLELFPRPPPPTIGSEKFTKAWGKRPKPGLPTAKNLAARPAKSYCQLNAFVKTRLR